MESWKADEKQRDEVKSEERRCNRAKVRRKKIHPRQMLEKSRNAVFFQWFVCQVSRKVGSLKRRVRSHVVRGEIKNCTPLWREAHFQVKMYKTCQVRTAFWSWDVEKLHAAGEKHIFKWKCTKHYILDVEKLHAAVARSTFPSKNVQNTSAPERIFWSWDVEKLHAAVARSTFPSKNIKKNWRSQSTFWSWDVEKLHADVQNTSASDHFLKLRCQKIARRCGEKHICKWKCTKHYILGPLFEVAMSKNCTPLWREAHSTFASENVQNTTFSDHFLKLRCRKIARRCGAKHIAHLQVKMHKTLHSRTTFWSWDVEKLHAAAARSTFPSQNVKKLTVSEHFLKLRCWKIARRCGEKHISKSKC